METLQQILSEETQKYVSTLSVGDDDYSRIEQELMEKIQTRILLANNNNQKGISKISSPKQLPVAQIAYILNAIFIIKILKDADPRNDAQELLGVYNDDEGIYETSFKKISQAAFSLNSSLTENELTKQLRTKLLLICDEAYINNDPNLIAVNNGIFDYTRKVLMPFDPDKYVFTSKAAIDYKPNVPLKTFSDGWNVEAWIHEISADDEVYELLWQVIGAIFRPHVPWDQAILFYSKKGNNGKGTLCELMRNLLGSKTYTNLTFEQMSDERLVGSIVGKQAIITDEANVNALVSKLENVKAIITHDVITINNKFEAPFSYAFHGIVIQCINSYPSTKDKTESFYRRCVIIPFLKSYTGIENKKIKSEYIKDTDVLEYCLSKAMNSDYDKFIQPEICKNELQTYKDANDTLRQFWNDVENEFQWDLLPYTFLFDLYSSWYKRNYPSSQQAGRQKFIEGINELVDTTTSKFTVSKKRVRTKGRITDIPEPLIVEYKLTNWYSKTYRGYDPKKLSTLTEEEVVQNSPGLVRKTKNNNNNSDNDNDDTDGG